jgi:hypothetical protein
LRSGLLPCRAPGRAVQSGRARLEKGGQQADRQQQQHSRCPAAPAAGHGWGGRGLSAELARRWWWFCRGGAVAGVGRVTRTCGVWCCSARETHAARRPASARPDSPAPCRPRARPACGRRRESAGAHWCAPGAAGAATKRVGGRATSAPALVARRLARLMSHRLPTCPPRSSTRGATRRAVRKRVCCLTLRQDLRGK